MISTDNSLTELLETLADFGSIKSPDFTAICVPILEFVSQLHQDNLVAFITSPDQALFNGTNLYLDTEGRSALNKRDALFHKPINRGPLEISGSLTEVSDLDQQTINQHNEEIYVEEQELKKPVYIADYKCWDYELGHYDPMTDVFQLGQILASIAYNLDFAKKEDLKAFVGNRKNLYFLNRELHPTIHAVIYEMTSLYIEDRTKNLEEAVSKLKNYREYNPENYVDLTQTEGFRNQDVSKRKDWILSKLKNRLFDISRRNKLLYFTERQSFLNLTISSVPLLLDHQNIKEDSLIIWNDKIKKRIVKDSNLPLNRFIEFKENRFIAPSLNKMRLEARKSKNEYGFSQLRTVIAFMHWYNFRENQEERITSPLLLLPADVTKQKGVEDQYAIKFISTEAEINPILSYYLKDLYDITLPDFVDLETTSIEELVESIEAQIAKGGTGITLQWRKKPKIQLIHSIAKKNFNLKNKKLANKSRGFKLSSFSYSYDNSDFQPLGLQIFNDFIRQKNSALEYIINEDLNPRNNAVAEKSRTFYSADNDGEINPHIWEVDTCNITVGNFNYRKMSLVRDYNEIINSEIQDAVFDQLFSELPKKLNSHCAEVSFENDYPIISSDPTQTSAIQIARTGESYIIQGPPGTGKSQTITNLIADYISRDKKILFVCEKRAALDVVYHRLKNKKLDELCCLVHDSQMDKKAFIQDLKSVYNDFQENLLDSTAINEERQRIVDLIHREIGIISHFHDSMKEGEPKPLELFQVLHANNAGKTPPTDIECINLPTYSEWKENQTWIMEWRRELTKNKFNSYISDYPLAQLSAHVLENNNPKSLTLEYLDESIQLLDEFSELIDNMDSEGLEDKAFEDWINEFSFAAELRGLLEADMLSVLNPKSNEAKDLKKQHSEIKKKIKELSKYAEENKNWMNKFNAEDTQNALSRWKGYSSSIFRFINPGFYKLKKQIKTAYYFEVHQVKPTIISVLEKLSEEHQCQNDIQIIKNEIKDRYKLAEFETGCEWIIEQQKNPNKVLKLWLESDDYSYQNTLLDYSDEFQRLVELSKFLFGSIDKLNLSELEAKLALAKEALSSLSVFIPFIEDTTKQSEALKSCLYYKKWDNSDFAFQLAYKSLRDVYERNRIFCETDTDSLNVSIKRVNALLDKYYECNVETIRAKIRAQFLEKLRISESPAAQLSQEEKVLKKVYRSARKILENEFGKSMRYKSIRELTAADSQKIITTLKPVWLMSPLSVSDVLPIDTSIFDVVIYDEASQITVEEGVPSLFRTNQAIVVGDEMQMPPTNFFGSVSNSEEDEEETEDKIGISLDAESLLDQSSRKLASVMLGWHYRSRHENLISFSNAAFYQRNLLTIPDTKIQGGLSKPIEPISSLEDEIDLDRILSRSISFHYLENAIYANRKNRDEADYIALVVEKLLESDCKKSIGIVAFSMDQQSEIEDALERLASKNPQFETKLEEEYQRIDEDQFNGLFVKNLENVQGDERDIIIMSVCYGANASGKMIMNFGPINRRGGEKRLNVIFSRAKEHMVVVSSILSSNITNDYNEGANYFKRFLNYAKHSSDGNLDNANHILDSMYSFGDEEKTYTETPIVRQLATALEEKGYNVDLAVGQSHFKCDLALKMPDSDKYHLGIIIDQEKHYENNNTLEQYCQKPEILRAFGWRIATVYSKDWFERPERVLEIIDQNISGETNDDEVLEDFDKELNPPMVTAELESSELPQVVEESESLVGAQDTVFEEPKPDFAGEVAEDAEFERYEFHSTSSKKYWEVSVSGNTMTVQYGRIGNKPQKRDKVFDSNEVALKEKGKAILTKTKKGYTRAETI